MSSCIFYMRRVVLQLVSGSWRQLTPTQIPYAYSFDMSAYYGRSQQKYSTYKHDIVMVPMTKTAKVILSQRAPKLIIINTVCGCVCVEGPSSLEVFIYGTQKKTLGLNDTQLSLPFFCTSGASYRRPLVFLTSTYELSQSFGHSQSIRHSLHACVFNIRWGSDPIRGTRHSHSDGIRIVAKLYILILHWYSSTIGDRVNQTAIVVAFPYYILLYGGHATHNLHIHTSSYMTFRPRSMRVNC